jgi:hypothetical protein
VHKVDYQEGCQACHLPQREEVTKTLSSPSTLAASLSQLSTPIREAHFNVFLVHEQCESTIKKVIDLVRCSLNFALSNCNTPLDVVTSSVHPFHFNKPNCYGGHHGFIGQDLATFNL